MDPIFRLKRFSQLPDAGVLTGDEIIPLSRPDQDYRTTFAEFLNYIERSDGSGGEYTVEALETSGTWQCPAGIIGLVKYRMVGAGASGSVSGNHNSPGVSGVPGGYAEGTFAPVPETGYPYVVGAGGLAHPVGAPVVPGNDGGDTSIFGVTAEGGKGSPPSAGIQGSLGGGVTGNATIAIQNVVVDSSQNGVTNGPTPFGVQAFNGNRSGNVDSTGYGVGGLGGASSTNEYPGTDGKPGLIILEYFVIPDPEEP